MQGNVIQEAITLSQYSQIETGFRTVFGCNCECSERRLDFPDEYGSGSFTCKALTPFMELWSDAFTSHLSFERTGLCMGDFYCASFCLSGVMEWEEQISHACFRLEKGGGAFYHIREINEICCCDSGQNINGFCIMIHPDRIKNIILELSENPNIFQHIYSNFKLGYFHFPGECMSVIKQLQNCPYTGSIRTLYIEGKVSELLAICLHELSSSNARQKIEIKLSGPDMAGLDEARRILDASLSDSVSIRDLSRLVGLNEYKLKKGFTQLYGIPIHAYLVEKRMLTARELLRQRSRTVSEVAEYVGYSCPGSFSRAFRKKYGFNPSDCY